VRVLCRTGRWSGGANAAGVPAKPATRVHGASVLYQVGCPAIDPEREGGPQAIAGAGGGLEPEGLCSAAGRGGGEVEPDLRGGVAGGAGGDRRRLLSVGRRLDQGDPGGGAAAAGGVQAGDRRTFQASYDPAVGAADRGGDRNDRAGRGGRRGDVCTDPEVVHGAGAKSATSF